MKLKTKYFYILAAFISVFILLAAGFVKYYPYVRKTSAALKQLKPTLSGHISQKPLGAPDCKGKTVFACTAEYLRYLRYLPITPSSAGRNKYEFPFTVPAILRSAADSYEWNSQNPFVLGAAAQYLGASGGISDGEYVKPQINGLLLSKLKKSASKGEFDTHRWKWVLVRQAKKGEKVELYENGRKIFSSPANTGEFATTPDGTWYVFVRFHDTKMSGLSPERISKRVYASLKLKHYKMVGCLDGHPVKMVHYDDSGIKYVSYFNNNIALHYMLRPRYGFPQSAGCIELPERDAKFLYKNIGYGTMVTVIGSAGNAAAKKRRAGTCSE